MRFLRFGKTVKTGLAGILAELYYAGIIIGAGFLLAAVLSFFYAR